MILVIPFFIIIAGCSNPGDNEDRVPSKDSHNNTSYLSKTEKDQSFQISEDEEFQFKLDAEEKGEYVLLQTEGPKNGKLLNCLLNYVSKNCTYVPNKNFNGTDKFSYYKKNSRSKAPAATVSFKVSAINDAPKFPSDKLVYKLESGKKHKLNLPLAIDPESKSEDLIYKISDLEYLNNCRTNSKYYTCDFESKYALTTKTKEFTLMAMDSEGLESNTVSVKLFILPFKDENQDEVPDDQEDSIFKSSEQDKRFLPVPSLTVKPDWSFNTVFATSSSNYYFDRYYKDQMPLFYTSKTKQKYTERLAINLTGKKLNAITSHKARDFEQTLYPVLPNSTYLKDLNKLKKLAKQYKYKQDESSLTLNFVITIPLTTHYDYIEDVEIHFYALNVTTGKETLLDKTKILKLEPELPKTITHTIKNIDLSIIENIYLTGHQIESRVVNYKTISKYHEEKRPIQDLLEKIKKNHLLVKTIYPENITVGYIPNNNPNLLLYLHPAS